MADKKKAFAWLFEIEGGLALIPGDAGGLTYCGITRRYWPEWSGWAILLAHGDSLVDARRELAEHKEEIDALVDSFYHAHYWIPMRLYDDRVPDQVAAELLEFGAHTTTAEAIGALQEVLNGLNVDDEGTEPRWPALVVDGRIGPKTLGAMAIADKRGYAWAVAVWVNVLQGRNLWQRKRERFNAGWARRLKVPCGPAS